MLPQERRRHEHPLRRVVGVETSAVTARSGRRGTPALASGPRGQRSGDRQTLEQFQEPDPCKFRFALRKGVWVTGEAAGPLRSHPVDSSLWRLAGENVNAKVKNFNRNRVHRFKQKTQHGEALSRKAGSSFSLSHLKRILAFNIISLHFVFIVSYKDKVTNSCHALRKSP